jgi:hypothetical protein
MEKKLHALLVARRKRGRRCSARWLSHTARALMRDELASSPGAADFKAGPRWRRRFLQRLHMTTRRKTNRKNTTWEEAKTKLQHHFKRFKLWLVERAKAKADRGLSVDPKYGAFPLHRRFNVDQVPLPFINFADTTYEEKGATQVRINGLQDALAKRQATLQVCARPVAPPRPPASDAAARSRYDKHIMQQPRMCIIFRGTGARISQAEKDAYHPSIDVLWQPKAWVDRPTAEAWAVDSFSSVIAADKAAGVINDGDEYLLLQDNLDAQLQPNYIRKLKNMGVVSRWLLAGHTDYVQPVDAGLGRQLKIYIGQEMDEWLDDDDNLEKWEDNSLTASDRRVLLTHWTAAAWAKAYAKPETVHAYFEHTGANMQQDGSCGFKFAGMTETFEFSSVVLPRAERPEQAADDEPDEVGSEVDDREPCLDDFDDADDEDVPLAPLKAPDGWLILATAPGDAALQFSKDDSQAADALVGRKLLYNWTAVGWCVGSITRRNKDGRRKVDGKIANFYVHYEIDDEEATHVLEVSMYAHSAGTGAAAEPNQWVLLEQLPTTAAS